MKHIAEVIINQTDFNLNQNKFYDEKIEQLLYKRKISIDSYNYDMYIFNAEKNFGFVE